MKRLALLTVCALCVTVSALAQKFAFVDTEYLMKNIPLYESASQQLEQSSKKWQKLMLLIQRHKQCTKTINRTWFILVMSKKEQEQAIVAKKQKQKN